jgi:hypothetical protein
VDALPALQHVISLINLGALDALQNAIKYVAFKVHLSGASMAMAISALMLGLVRGLCAEETGRA